MPQSKITDTKVTTNARGRVGEKPDKPNTHGLFSPELFTAICSRIAEGESLNRICAERAMPSRKTFFQWVAKDRALEAEYSLALRIRADYFVDEIIEIADDSNGDEIFIESTDKDGHGVKHVYNHENINRSRLRVEARKWAASKLNPKKYGDRITTEHEGNIDFKYQNLTDEQLLARVKELAGKLGINLHPE